MSFGYSIGDFILLTQLAYSTVQNARKACGAHDELAREVNSLHIVLTRLQIEVSKPASILNSKEDDRRTELAILAENCRRVLRVLNEILGKYNALSEEKRSLTKLWQKVKFGNGEMMDLGRIRTEMATNTQAISLFLNLLGIGSQGKVEMYMQSHGKELSDIKTSLHWVTAILQAKEGSVEKSVLTNYSGDDKAVWRAFRRELIKEGFSSRTLGRHKRIIQKYVLELGERGMLDEKVEKDVSDDLDEDLGSLALPDLNEQAADVGNNIHDDKHSDAEAYGVVRDETDTISELHELEFSDNSQVNTLFSTKSDDGFETSSSHSLSAPSIFEDDSDIDKLVFDVREMCRIVGTSSSSQATKMCTYCAYPYYTAYAPRVKSGEIDSGSARACCPSCWQRNHQKCIACGDHVSLYHLKCKANMCDSSRIFCLGCWVGEPCKCLPCSNRERRPILDYPPYVEKLNYLPMGGRTILRAKGFRGPLVSSLYNNESRS